MSCIIVLIGILHGECRFQQSVRDGIFKEDHPVFIQFVKSGVSDKLVEVLFRTKDRVLEASIDKGILVPFKTAVYYFENTDLLIFRNISGIGFQHFLSYESFYFRKRNRCEIFICFCFQLISFFFNLCGIFAFKCFFQSVG